MKNNPSCICLRLNSAKPAKSAANQSLANVSELIVLTFAEIKETKRSANPDAVNGKESGLMPRHPFHHLIKSNAAFVVNGMFKSALISCSGTG